MKRERRSGHFLVEPHEGPPKKLVCSKVKNPLGYHCRVLEEDGRGANTNRCFQQNCCLNTTKQIKCRIPQLARKIPFKHACVTEAITNDKCSAISTTEEGTT